MALGTTAALLLAGGAFSAATAVGSGNAQSKAIVGQATYDAEIYSQQAEMVKHKKEIQEYQFNREAARVRGSVVARTAGKGLMLSGSPLAILIDNESQMQFDKAIGDYNLNVQENYARSGAKNTMLQGAINSRNARTAGYSTAFSTLLNTGFQYGLMNMSNPLAKKG